MSLSVIFRSARPRQVLIYVYGRFYTKDALSVWTNLGKHLEFIWLRVSSIKTGTRRILRLD